jgi:hypothetical protein
MKQEAHEKSLTSDFQAKATLEEKRARQAVRDAAKLRNKANRKAIGEWHNESRGENDRGSFS